MKGIWTWPSEAEDQDEVLRKVRQEDELVTILVALGRSPNGLSNSQLDRLLINNSQWRTLPHLKELMAMGFVEYHVQFFGDAGKYTMTELGKAIMPRIQAPS